MTDEEDAEASDCTPVLLWARTVKVYATPAVRPLILIGEDALDPV